MISWMQKVCVAAILLGVALPVAAQPRDGKADKRSLEHSKNLLLERDRALMHPGDPLRNIDPVEDTHDLRSGTPALEQSDRAATLVNPDELHRRTLALYETRASFHEPLLAASGLGASLPSGSEAAEDADHASVNGSARGQWYSMLAFIVSGVLLLWAGNRTNWGRTGKSSKTPRAS